jgi:CBS domain-containing protein
MGDKKTIKFYGTPVGRIMNKDLPLIERSAPMSEVAERLLTIHHLWVVDQRTKKLVGIITEKDFLDVISPLPARSWVIGVIRPKSWHHAEFETAGDIMVKHVVKCNKLTTVEEALSLMRRYRLRRLPVIENDKIVGEITSSALIKGYVLM